MDHTIFNYVDSVLFTKKKLNMINEGETQFNLYMLNRWCSMYSPDIAQIINETTNRYTKSISLKQDQYEFSYNILPKCKKRKIDYLKKNKTEKIKEDEDIKNYSKLLEISEREISLYIDINNSICI